MPEKLAESTWSAFTKKHKLELEDGALRKALARWDKTDESRPGPRVDALDDLVAQIHKQVLALARKKKELGDKPFGLAKDKLHELLDLAEAARRQADVAAAESEEPDSPVLLTTRMLPLVRELRKGQARMPALISTAGRETAVLILRRAIAPTRRKLMQDYLDAQGGLKHIGGQCGFEQGALTFVVASPGAGLAKRIRAALQKQLGLRLKVRVRGDDGVEDEDGEDGGDEQAGEAQAGAAQQQPPPPPDAPAPPAALAYTQRLRQLQPRLDQALRAQHAEASKLRALSGFASEKAASEDYAAATQALQMIEKLLDSAPASSGTGAVEPGVAFKARMVALIPRIKEAIALGGAAALQAKPKASEAAVAAGRKNFDQANALLDEVESLLAGTPSPARDTAAMPGATGGLGGIAWPKLLLRWRSAQSEARGAIEQLGRAILAMPQVQGDPRFAQVQIAVSRLPGLVPDLGSQLGDLLDQGLNEGSNDGIAAQARLVTAQYRQQLAAAASLARLEQFARAHVGDLQVLRTLDGALAEIDENLAR